MSIIVRLIGGLGNQMFQYAAGRALSHRLNRPLKVDISGFSDYPDREYKLGIFPIQADIATSEEVAALKDLPEKGLLRYTGRVRRKYFPWHKQRYIRERSFAFDSDFHRIRQGCYLEGYWQSEKYYNDIEEIIRREFTISEPPDSRNREFLEFIKSAGNNSVSVHIRRGDYIHNADIKKVHHFPGITYYRNAVETLKKEVKNPVFFIFSDDITWARENLDVGGTMMFADHNGPENDVEDLRLMSHCTRHVIANSTFSWWGAWLSTAASKQVIAPAQWFTEEASHERPTGDLIPDRWMRL